MYMEKLIWVRADLADTYEERKNIVTAALEAGLTDIVIREEDEQLRRLGRFNALVLRGDEVFLGEQAVARLVTVTGPEDLEAAYSLKGTERVIVSSRDWKVIPLENLIAIFHGSGTQLMAEAGGVEESGSSWRPWSGVLTAYWSLQSRSNWVKSPDCAPAPPASNWYLFP